MCSHKRRRGSKGEPSPGVPPFSLRLCVCADTLGGGRWLVLRFDPISLVLAQRNGVEPPKKSAFLPRRLHQSRERCCLGCLYSSSPDLGKGLVGRPGAQVSLTQSAVMLGLRVRGRGGWDRTCPVAAPISAFLWGSTPFLCARAKKWGGTGRASAVYCPRKRRTRNRARQGGLVIALSACAPIRWEVVDACPAFRPHFFGACPKKRCRAAKEKRFFYLGGSTIRVSAASR